MGPRRPGTLGAAVLGGVLLLAAGPAGASPPAADTVDAAGHASPLLPAGHWAAAAARRLDEMGLAPAGYPTGARRPTRRDAARALVSAAAGRDTLSSGAARLAAGLLERFEEEFPVAAAAARDGRAPRDEPGGGGLSAGVMAEEGGLLAGEGFEPGADWEGPFPLEEMASPAVSMDAALHMSRFLVLHGRGTVESDDLTVEDLYAAGTVGPVTVWGGRMSEGWGPGAGGSLVLTDPPPMNGGGIRTAEPFHLPFFLDALGPLRLSVSLRQLSANRFEAPWLLAQRFSLEPHPRFRFTGTRAMIFGGEGNAPVTLGNVWTAFWGDFGGEAGEFENQVASAEFLYRLPVGTPVTAYLEYGFDDLSGGYLDTPAWVAGARLPALPGAPEVGLGAEWTHFAERCCGNPYWYRHFAFTRGWTEEGRVFAHPLGGHGDELSVYAEALIPSWGAWLEARAYRRDRGRENLFAPTWEGVSWGARVRVDGRLGEGWRWVVEAEGERGEGGWSRERVFTGVRMLF